MQRLDQTALWFAHLWTPITLAELPQAQPAPCGTLFSVQSFRLPKDMLVTTSSSITHKTSLTLAKKEVSRSVKFGDIAVNCYSGMYSLEEQVS